MTLPPGVNAVVDADMHFAGDINIDGSQRSGFDQSLTRTVTGSDRARTPPPSPSTSTPASARSPSTRTDHRPRKENHHVRPHLPQPPADRSVKVPHLVFGLLFLGVAGIWALGASDVDQRRDRLPVLGPALLIGAGVIGLVASLANGRNRRRTETLHTPEPDPAPETEPPTLETEDEPTEEIR